MDSILSFIVNITTIYHFESLLLLSPQPFTESYQNLSRATGLPIISINCATSINVRDNFSHELLAIVDVQLSLYTTVLQKLAEVLHYVRQSKVLLMLDQGGPNEALLLEIFHICWQNKMLNVIAVGSDFWQAQRFYGYSPYPHMHIEQKFSPADVIFPDRMLDLQGSAIKTLADQIEPRDMLSMSRDGKIRLHGYVGHVMSAFIEKHNARLVFPFQFEIGKSTYYAGLRKLVFNDTLDLLVSVTIMNVSSELYSYTLEQNAYCVMLPVEANIPTFRFFVVITDVPVIALTSVVCLIISTLMVVVSHQLDKRRKITIMDIVLNVDCIRGILSQSFNLLKSSSSVLMLVYCLISVLGMYFTTWYLAFLQTYLTYPPREPTIMNFKDFAEAGLKVLIYEREYTEVYDLLTEPLSYNVFQVTSVYSEFENAMDTMNASYGYYVPGSKWRVLKAKQQLFSKPLVRLSDMCVMTASHFGFALHEDSIYRTTLNRLILQVQESGLLYHWMDNSFYELVQMNRMNFSDWTISNVGFKQLRAKDLWLVFVVFLVAHGANLLVFFGEIVVHRARTSEEIRPLV